MKFLLRWQDRFFYHKRQIDSDSWNWNRSITNTRQHSSRMRTVRCSGHLPGGGKGGGFAQGCVCPGGCIPACTEVDPLPVDRILDTRLWKYYLASTLLRTVTRQHSSRMRIARLPTVCAVVVTIRPLSVSSGGGWVDTPGPVSWGVYIPTPCPLVYPPSCIPNIPLVYPPPGYTPRTYPPRPSEGTWDQVYPPTPCRQTDTCENITFPQLLLRAVKANKVFWTKDHTSLFRLGIHIDSSWNSMFILSIIGLRVQVCISQGWYCLMFYVNLYVRNIQIFLGENPLFMQRLSWYCIRQHKPWHSQAYFKDSTN